MATTPETSNRYLTAAQVCARFGGITTMTLHRWLNSATVAFPKPMVVNRLRLFRESDIEKWEAERSQKAA